MIFLSILTALVVRSALDFHFSLSHSLSMTLSLSLSLFLSLNVSISLSIYLSLSLSLILSLSLSLPLSFLLLSLSFFFISNSFCNCFPFHRILEYGGDSNSNAHGVISEHLLTFDDVTELQTRNSQLLQVLRKLSVEQVRIFLQLTRHIIS